MAHSHSSAPAHAVKTIDISSATAARAGVILATAEGHSCDGRTISLDGRRLLNFGSCSYLALEFRHELRNGAIMALQAYGTQFSISRIYLQNPLYVELEETLEEMTGAASVLVVPSCTVAHQAALPVLVGPGDAVVIDQFAHASMHAALAMLDGPTLLPLRHSRMDRLEAQIRTLSAKCDRVWYLCDGLYSMHGDFAPIDELSELLERYPKLHLYIDDAHSTSWLGPRGSGLAAERLSRHERVAIVLSLNKGFAAAGSALLLPSGELCDRVRRCGGPMIFSGPIQPPMLGVAVASARLHLTPEFSDLQADLQERIQLMLELSSHYGLPITGKDASPIFFLRCGPADLTYRLVNALRERGFFVCPSAFPAVPVNHSGIRWTMTLHNRVEDIERLALVLSQELERLDLHDSVPAMGA